MKPRRARQVYKAVLDNNQEVAVKFFNPEQVAGSLAASRESEIQIMRMCNHTAIVGLHGCWVRQVRTLAILMKVVGVLSGATRRPRGPLHRQDDAAAVGACEQSFVSGWPTMVDGHEC